MQCGGATLATPAIHFGVMPTAWNGSWCYDPGGTASVNSASVPPHREHGRYV